MRTPRGKTQITWAAITIAILAIAGVTFARFNERRDTIELATNTIDNYASIIAEQVNNGVVGVDLTLQEIVDHWLARESRQTFAASASGGDFGRHLDGDVIALPLADFVAVVDDGGNVIASSRDAFAAGANIGELSAFRSIRDSSSDKLLICKPDNEIRPGAWTILFSRRITTEKGVFLGAVIAGVRPRMLLWTHNPLSSTLGQSYGVFRKDGITLIRDLEGRDMTGAKIDQSSPWYAAVQAGGGRYRVDVAFDGQERYVSTRPLPQYPLVVTASASADVVLHEWRKRTALIGLLLAGYLAVGFVAVRIVRNRYDALELSRARTQALAEQDSLCAIANRSYFLEHLQRLLADARGGDAQIALVLLDVDAFKDINDTFGHVAGDKVIQAIANGLSEICPEGLPARLGGDEFALVCRAPSLHELNAKAEEIREAASRPVVCDHNRIAVHMSAGVKILVSPELDIERILRRADLALYAAKRRGGNCHVVFEPSLEAEYLERSTLAEELRNAVTNGQLAVHYQPIVRLGDSTTVAIEALARWPHPTRGAVGPDLFIPLAEDIGLISELGAYVLDRACRDLTKLQPGLRVCVNVSPLQLAQDGFVGMVEAVLMRYGICPNALEMEVTETILLQNTAHNMKILDDLRALGVHVALDDFGTGYSSLGYLKNYAFDTIKIDRSFVIDAHESIASAKIIAATTMLAESLGLRTIAEGIETAEHLEAVRAAGVTCGQGYLLGRPVPIAEIEKTLGRSESTATAAA
ncbi:MAG: EAL domain-containing protein [Beijerinckiaceae bacterium]